MSGKTEKSSISAETKTLDEWAALDGIRILDPDGFDRTDPELSTRQFTKAEYARGIDYCTVERRCEVCVEDYGDRCTDENCPKRSYTNRD